MQTAETDPLVKLVAKVGEHAGSDILHFCKEEAQSMGMGPIATMEMMSFSMRLMTYLTIQEKIMFKSRIEG